jgi:hypothetical protein
VIAAKDAAHFCFWSLPSGSHLYIRSLEPIKSMHFFSVGIDDDFDSTFTRALAYTHLGLVWNTEK